MAEKKITGALGKMTTPVLTSGQKDLFERLRARLDHLGYRGDLWQEGYRFDDWFYPGGPERTVPAAAFAQTPLAYDTACFAVVFSNGKGESGLALIKHYRSLGAPRAFEIRGDRIVHWRVSVTPKPKDQQGVIWPHEIESAFAENADRWKPEEVLRAKNIAAAGPRQQDFIDLGLIPALESHVRAKLNPLLQGIIHDVNSEYQQRTGNDPDWEQLYRLVFRAVAGKIMHDRGVRGFTFRGQTPNPDDLLNRVADHYSDPQPVIEDPTTRRMVVSRLWESVSFQNLSVEILAFIWENLFVTKKARETQGIHATPPPIARYMVHRLSMRDIPQGERFVVEPCCGTGTFMVAALQHLRELLPPFMDPRERHKYFVQMLRGADNERFGLEIARPCLMLADFPNPNGWKLYDEDVFATPNKAPGFYESLKVARVVLCNPPFEDFTPKQQQKYAAKSPHRPVELLNRVLDHVNPQAVLGFVLPATVINGSRYRTIRERLASRFRNLEIVYLPEGAFQKAGFPCALVLAKKPSTGHKKVRVSLSTVTNVDRFLETYAVKRRDTEVKTVAAAGSSFAVLQLRKLWDHLAKYPRLGSCTSLIRRGVEWEDFKKNRERYVSEKPLPGYVPGFLTADEMLCFEAPKLVFLWDRQESRRRNAWKLPWDRPKVVFNAVRRSRGSWWITACPVELNVLCSQNFTVAWPDPPWTPRSLAAVLNGPVASAFVATRERLQHLRKGTIKRIPLPVLSAEQIQKIDELVARYQALASVFREWGPVEAGLFSTSFPSNEDLIGLLAMIDAEVIRGYNLPADVEQELLSFFHNHRRRVRFDYDLGAVSEVLSAHPDALADPAQKAGYWEYLQLSLSEEHSSDRKLFP